MLYEELPYIYKIIDLMGEDEIPGKLVASAQPGGRFYNSSYNFALLDRINNGEDVDELEFNQTLIKDLASLHEDNIHHIYNLIDIPSTTGVPELSKYIWEKKYLDSEYITEINGVKVGIEDFHAPTQDQLTAITDDITKKIKTGENCLVHCLGGLGRTGTILAAIYMKISKDHNPDKAIKYIREHYINKAIETSEQEDSLREFAKNL